MKRKLGPDKKKTDSDSDWEYEDEGEVKPSMIQPEHYDPSRALAFETEPPDYQFEEEHIDSYNAEKEAAAKEARDARDPEPYVEMNLTIC